MARGSRTVPLTSADARSMFEHFSKTITLELTIEAMMSQFDAKLLKICLEQAESVGRPTIILFALRLVDGKLEILEVK